MIFLKLTKFYHKGMFRTKVGKIMVYVSKHVENFKDLGRTMEIYVQELITRYRNYYEGISNYSK